MILGPLIVQNRLVPGDIIPLLKQHRHVHTETHTFLCINFCVLLCFVVFPEERRKLYDQFGEEGLKQGMGAGGGYSFEASDLFSQLFGGRGGGLHGQPMGFEAFSKMFDMGGSSFSFSSGMPGMGMGMGGFGGKPWKEKTNETLKFSIFL